MITSQPLPILTPAEVTRYWSKMRVAGCGLLWGGETNNDGYGRFPVYRSGKRIRLLAHRMSCFLLTGKDPGPSLIRHQCDIPPCCTPDCFLLGTQADNIADAIARRRLNTTGLSAYRAIRIAEAAARANADEKPCSRCGHGKPMTDFPIAMGNPDGRAYWCRLCVSEHQALQRPPERLLLRGALSERERYQLNRKGAA